MLRSVVRAAPLLLGVSVVTTIWSLGANVLNAAQKQAAPADADRSDSENFDGLLLQARAIFGQLPAAMPGAEDDTPAMVALGQKLYFEKAMSTNKTQSCNDCHRLDGGRGGVDNQWTSEGALGKFGPRNAPTVLNAGFHVAQFWDGRVDDLVEQAKGPPLNPIEMGMEDGEAVAQRAAELPYADVFAVVFPDDAEPITFDNVARAIAAFERTLISRGRFDDYLAGQTDALTHNEKEGLSLVLNRGCAQCHGGPLLGGMLYQEIGVFHPYKNREDLGRFKQTGKESDKYVFKIPSLRNVTLTAPYFHDGQVATLAEAVDSRSSRRSSLVSGDRETFTVPPMWQSRFGPSRTKRLAVAFLGGMIMIFGARLASGCTSGHGISGNLQLVVSSIVFSVLFFGFGVATVFLLYGKKGGTHV